MIVNLVDESYLIGHEHVDNRSQHALFATWSSLCLISHTCCFVMGCSLVPPCYNARHGSLHTTFRLQSTSLEHHDKYGQCVVLSFQRIDGTSNSQNSSQRVKLGSMQVVATPLIWQHILVISFFPRILPLLCKMTRGN